MADTTEEVQASRLVDETSTKSRSAIRRLIDRFPESSRPALYYETLANVCAGAYLTAFSLAMVVLKSILEADALQVALLAVFFFGSSLFSPLVTYVGRVVPMKTLVVAPNVVVAIMLFLTLLPGTSSLFFAVLVGATFVVRVFPRAAEMNMYRILYPDTHRSTAIGITKAVGAVTGLLTTFLGWAIFALDGAAYPALFCFLGTMLALSAWFYSRIPVPDANPYASEEAVSPWRAFARGCGVFLSDRRFLGYQLAFAVAGIANHISLWYVVDVLEDGVHASKTVQSWVVAILPALFVIASSPVWGRLLDGWNPMSARSVFNAIQTIAYGFYALGGWMLQSWPFVVGAVLHAIGNGGGMINWLTGSMYFARSDDQVPLYNGIHVCLTGVRGIAGPIIGYLLATSTKDFGDFTLVGLGLGWRVFLVSAVLSFVGFVSMLLLAVVDRRSRTS